MAVSKRTRVLCVDDELNILEGLKLHLGRSFDMTTAQTGEEAIELIANDGPYAVVVTDMRMPSMNGIQLLQAAKPLAPDTTFIMLTGSHDLETATKAVNEGHVFRFLNKPCPSNILKIAIDDGIERFNMLKEKREVLNETFVGSIRLMTEILEMSHPATFSRAHQVENITLQLTRALGIEERWEFKLACRLSRIGSALLGAEASKDEGKSWAWESEAGLHLVRLIPRLKLVSEIIGKWGTSKGVFPTVVATEEEAVTACASIIHAAWILEGAFREGKDTPAAVVELQRRMPQACERLVDASSKLAVPAAFTKSTDRPTKSVDLKQLKEGMTLGKELRIGDFYLAAGHRLSQAMILRLSYLFQTNPEMAIEVFA